MSTPNEPKYYQHIELHMKNGEVVHVYEDYDIPVEDGIVGDFKKKKKKYMLLLKVLRFLLKVMLLH